MKREQIAGLLNQDLSGEIEAILTYMRNSFVASDCGPSRSMEEIARDEMRHAEKLAEMIVDLGGTPSLVHRELDFGRKGVPGALKRLIALEREAIAMYREHIAMIPDAEIKRRLTHILHEEEEHIGEFKELLTDVGKVS